MKGCEPAKPWAYHHGRRGTRRRACRQTVIGTPRPPLPPVDRQPPPWPPSGRAARARSPPARPTRPATAAAGNRLNLRREVGSGSAMAAVLSERESGANFPRRVASAGDPARRQGAYEVQVTWTVKSVNLAIGRRPGARHDPRLRTAPPGMGYPGRATTDRPAAPHRLTTGPGSLEGLSDRPAGGPRPGAADASVGRSGSTGRAGPRGIFRTGSARCA